MERGREHISALRNRLKLTERELKRRGIVAIILFGSSLKGRIHPLSDVDIAVLFKDEPPERDIEWLYLELQRDLRREVDLIILNKAPPRIRFSALKGELLYVGDERELIHFMTKVYDEWADLEYLRRVIWNYTERWLTVGG